MIMFDYLTFLWFYDISCLMIEIKETLWVLQNIEYDDGGRGNGASLVMMKKGILTYINPSLHTTTTTRAKNILLQKYLSSMMWV